MCKAVWAETFRFCLGKGQRAMQQDVYSNAARRLKLLHSSTTGCLHQTGVVRTLSKTAHQPGCCRPLPHWRREGRETLHKFYNVSFIYTMIAKLELGHWFPFFPHCSLFSLWCWTKIVLPSVPENFVLRNALCSGTFCVNCLSFTQTIWKYSSAQLKVHDNPW